MKILCLDRLLPGATPERIYPLLRAEVAHAFRGYENDLLREWYFRRDRPGAVLVLECASPDEARGYVDGLPLARAGLVAFDLIPLGPFLPLKTLFGPGALDDPAPTQR
jgi:hypothetical protein